MLLQELRLIELDELSGWRIIPLVGYTVNAPPTQDDEGRLIEKLEEPDGPLVPLCTFFLQLAVLTNHQNGRDTHVRGVRVYGPRTEVTECTLGLPLKMTSREFCMYANLR